MQAGGLAPAHPERTIELDFFRPHVLPMLVISVVCVLFIFVKI